MDDSHPVGKPSHGTTANRQLVLSAKINGTQRRAQFMKHTLAINGMCWAAVMSNSAKIKCIAIAIIKLYLFEGISSHVVSQ